MRLESFLGIKEHKGYPKNDEHFCSHIFHADAMKGGLAWFLLPKMFDHILCKDENIFFVFHIPNWVKFLN